MVYCVVVEGDEVVEPGRAFFGTSPGGLRVIALERLMTLAGCLSYSKSYSFATLTDTS